MKVDMYDVVRLRDGREATILFVHGKSEAFDVTDDDDDYFTVEPGDIDRVIWKASTHEYVK